ncbi:MAG: hypothetical protein NC038_00430 [Paludibacter sp.]|nr:hypothetical protein [Bacteroidales bacterium]MCM1068646.1 hypothetical protein [Prevotella sp.]MCM1353310.1 hypothetical protein [Bacteroides sp.]MCM1442282.1 hypothetical protein [Muribaculum sp.]MCM1481101.1 hypothetical protein [Paludibacter sp.]
MKVLIAPLNWGLGHASRCIPLINRYLRNGDDVTIAGDGESFVLLRKHYPNLRAVELPSLQLTYSAGDSQTGAILRQIPRILYHAWCDRLNLRALLNIEPFDLIISDNRFGFFDNRAKCVYITHQLLIPMPHRFRWIEPIAHRIHLRIMRHYNEIQIPDYEGKNNLSGKLSHYYPLPKNARFIGPLSRFSDIHIRENTVPAYDTVAVLSGLEPQRTRLEQHIIEESQRLCRRTLIVRGKTKEPFCTITHGYVTLVPYLDDPTLVEYMLEASTIIARSGYSTLMDLHALGVLHKAQLIPTPGQPEQEYLAKTLQGIRE